MSKVRPGAVKAKKAVACVEEILPGDERFFWLALDHGAVFYRDVAAAASVSFRRCFLLALRL